MSELTLAQLKAEVQNFVHIFSATPVQILYGVTDGKAVGTYIEQAFHRYLRDRYQYVSGSSASGIDLPGLEIDIKATSLRQPQSSCPFKNASQKVYGLGYHLLVFVYEKMDKHDIRAAQLNIRYTVFVTRKRTGDYQTTYGLREILRRNGNKDDIVAFLEERNLPLDEIGRDMLADRILHESPEIGYLTVSNALQWRLQYGRVLSVVGTIEGVEIYLRKDFGDFQTPPVLVSAVLTYLNSLNREWTRVIEPTCGQGNFIDGLLKQTRPPREIQGIEIQSRYVEQAQHLADRSPFTHVTIKHANLFELNLQKDLCWREKGPLLVMGNPPWVTNAELGALESTNLPRKANIKGLRGIEARTGQANFDIAEYIWVKLIKELASEQPTIALLCKTSVARNVFQYAFDAALPITYASLRRIDAKKWFGAAVDACLFHVEVGVGERCYQADVYEGLDAARPETTIGIVNSQLVGDIHTQHEPGTRNGTSSLPWRQGVKHDAASVMELTYDERGQLWNKLDEMVSVEPEYVYPLLKSSDLFHLESTRPQRAVILPQKKLGEDTRHLERDAPLLWSYLTCYAQLFERRKSSIYEGQPPFALFGIGDYSFTPYKVAISGLHKTPRFRAIGPKNGRPVLFDDTCYFIPCSFAEQAALLTSLLNDPVCLNFINSIVFLDSKRPITKKLLSRIDLLGLFQLVEQQALFARAMMELEYLSGAVDKHKLVWPSIEELLAQCSLSSVYNNRDEAIQQMGLWVPA